MTNVTLPMNTRARILAPGDAGFDVASRPWNLAVDQRPALVALPRHASDVAGIVIGAQAAGQQVAVQGGAHNPAPLGDLAHSVLIRTSAMDEVVIDPVRRIARVGAGALWSPVVEAAAAHGLYPLHGSSPDVGVVGYSLGGGVGWAARRHGLQADRIRAIELVTAGGSPLRVDERHDPDVFWALRGGGGGFGIVTAIEFELLPITSAYAGWLAWDWDESERVLGAWAEWAEGAPEAVTSAARILQLPPLPDIPEPLRGRRLVVIDGAVLADTADATRILGPLRTLRPEIDTFATLPAAALARLHGDPEAPVPVVSDHEMLGRLDPAAIATLVRVAGPESGSTLVAAELRQLGGALARPAPGGGALDHLDGEFLLFAAGLALDPDGERRSRDQAQHTVGAMAPWAAGRRYANFTEFPTDAGEFHDAATHRRLQAIRAQVDPDGIFRAAHDAD